MVFHEITRAAIDEAVDSPRDIDYGLVDAQETRRILDRLYGYEVSQVLWRKVNAGPVGRPSAEPRDPARRRARARAHGASCRRGYWDLEAALRRPIPAFTATLVASTASAVATGTDFDDNGRAKRRRRASSLDETAARASPSRSTAQRLHRALRRREAVPSTPKPPFMTSTLQQEGGRKLRMSASAGDAVAQGLYENGYITYMRTDSTTLSETALERRARPGRPSSSAREYLADEPRTLRREVKNAQEAHEAIRPAGETFRSPGRAARRAPRRRPAALRADLEAHARLPDGRRHAGRP